VFSSYINIKAALVSIVFVEAVSSREKPTGLESRIRKLSSKKSCAYIVDGTVARKQSMSYDRVVGVKVDLERLETRE